MPLPGGQDNVLGEHDIEYVTGPDFQCRLNVQVTAGSWNLAGRDYKGTFGQVHLVPQTKDGLPAIKRASV